MGHRAVPAVPESHERPGLIDGFYRHEGPTGVPLPGVGVAFPGTPANFDYTPRGWAGYEPTYERVLRRSCRTCHVSQSPSVQWLSFEPIPLSIPCPQDGSCGSLKSPCSDLLSWNPERIRRLAPRTLTTRSAHSMNAYRRDRVRSGSPARQPARNFSRRWISTVAQALCRRDARMAHTCACEIRSLSRGRSVWYRLRAIRSRIHEHRCR